jgi:GT2 family glycosyltransferase
MTSDADTPRTPPRVSVIVVSFNTREKLRHCLTALGAEHEVIVVDNASSDGSPAMVAADFPHAKLVANTENRGFGAANNQGLAIATGELVLLLNSDAYVAPDTVSRLAEVFADPNVVAAGPRLVNPDGSLQGSAARVLGPWAVFCEQTYLEKLLPGSRLLSPYWIRPSGDDTLDVEQVMGACLMMRPGERFDERFFLYCEDTDLCRRLRQRGRILYVPSLSVVHDLGSSSSQNRWRAVARYNHGKELYFRLHHGRAAWALCLVLDRLGALLRLVVWALLALASGLRQERRSQVALFARVLAAPIFGPLK